MAFRMSTLSVLRLNDYDKFTAKVQKSITKHRGVLMHVAQDLDVGPTTLKRWLREDAKLTRFLAKARKAAAKAA